MRIKDPSTEPWPEGVRAADVIPGFGPSAMGRTGVVRGKLLAGGTTPDGLNFGFSLLKYGVGEDRFESIRHHHTFEQVRIPIRGALNYGRGQHVPEGWISYFPQGAYYGPQVVEDVEAAVLQYGFGDDYRGGGEEGRALSTRPELPPRMKQAIERLVEEGEFRDGVYIATDPENGETRKRDAGEVITEAMTGKPVAIPEPRYPETIVINPDAFAWSDSPGNPDVLVKRLGTFGERELRLAKLRWEGGTYELAPDRAQLVLTLTDGLRAHGEAYPALTCVHCEMGEVSALAADAGTEAFVIDLPHVPPGLVTSERRPVTAATSS